MKITQGKPGRWVVGLVLGFAFLIGCSSKDANQNEFKLRISSLEQDQERFCDNKAPNLNHAMAYLVPVTAGNVTPDLGDWAAYKRKYLGKIEDQKNGKEPVIFSASKQGYRLFLFFLDSFPANQSDDSLANRKVIAYGQSKEFSWDADAIPLQIPLVSVCHGILPNRNNLTLAEGETAQYSFYLSPPPTEDVELVISQSSGAAIGTLKFSQNSDQDFVKSLKISVKANANPSKQTADVSFFAKATDVGTTKKSSTVGFSVKVNAVNQSQTTNYVGETLTRTLILTDSQDAVVTLSFEGSTSRVESIYEGDSTNNVTVNLVQQSNSAQAAYLSKDVTLQLDFTGTQATTEIKVKSGGSTSDAAWENLTDGSYSVTIPQGESSVTLGLLVEEENNNEAELTKLVRLSVDGGSLDSSLTLNENSTAALQDYALEVEVKDRDLPTLNSIASLVQPYPDSVNLDITFADCTSCSDDLTLDLIRSSSNISGLTLSSTAKILVVGSTLTSHTNFEKSDSVNICVRRSGLTSTACTGESDVCNCTGSFTISLTACQTQGTNQEINSSANYGTFYGCDNYTAHKEVLTNTKWSTGVTHSGNIEISDNTLTVTNSPTASGAITLTAGTLLVSSGGLTATGGITIPSGNFNITSGTLTANSATSLTGGNLTITTGNYSSNSSTSIASSSNLILGNGTFTTSGTTSLTGGNLTLTSGNFTSTSSLSLTSGILTMTSGNLSANSLTMAGTTLTMSNGSLSVTNNLTQSGGTLTTHSSGLSVGGTLSVSGGTFNMAGSPTLSGSVSISGGTMNMTGSPTISGNLVLSSGTLTIASGQTLTVSGSCTISGGTISNTGTLICSGNGSSLAGATISGASIEFNGTSTLDAGSLTTSSSTSLTFGGAATWSGGADTVNGTVTLSSGGSLTTSGTSPKTLANGTVTLNGGSLSLGTNLAISSALTHTASSSIALAGNTLTYSGAAVNLGAFTLTLSGTGNLTNTNVLSLNSASSTLALSGAATISKVQVDAAGTIQATANATISTLTLNNGATYNIASGSTLAVTNDLTLPATYTQTLSNSGTLSLGGALTYPAGAAVLATGAGSLTVTGNTTMANSSNQLTSSGGSITLSGSGTSISAGTLDVSGTAVTAQGTITPTTLTSSGTTTWSPGTGTLTTGYTGAAIQGNWTIASGGTLATSVSGVSLSGDMALSGSLSLANSATLSGALTVSGSPSITITTGTLTYSGAAVSLGANTLSLSGAGNFSNTNALTLDNASSTLTLGGTGTVALASVTAAGSINATESCTITTLNDSSSYGMQLAAGKTLTVTNALSPDTGTTVTLSSTGTLALTNGLTLNGTATLATAGASVSITPAFSMANGSLTSTGGSLTFGNTATVSGGSFDATGTTVNLGGAFSIKPTTLTTTGSTWEVGAHTLTWNGVSSPFAGDINIVGGSFVIDGGSSPIVSGTITYGSTIWVQVNTTFSGDIVITNAATMTIDSGVTATYTGAAINVGANTFIFDGAGTFNNSNSGSQVVLNNASSILQLDGASGSISAVQVNGADLVAGKIQVNQASTITTLSVTNSANIALAANLAVTNAFSIPTGKSVTLSSTGTLSVPNVVFVGTGTLATAGASLTCSSSFAMTTGTLTSSGGTLTFNAGGDITNATLDVSGTTVSLGGDLGLAPSSLTSNSSTQWTTNAHNLTWNGVGSPILGAWTIASGGTLTTGTTDGITVSGNISLAGTLAPTVNTTFGGNITLAGNASMNVSAGKTLTYSGAAVSLGANTLSLSGAGNFTNTNALTLDNASSTLTLGGTGTVALVSVTAAGSINATDSSTITTLNDSSSYGMQLAAGKTLTVTNALSPDTGTTLTLSSTGTLALTNGLTLNGTATLATAGASVSMTPAFSMANGSLTSTGGTITFTGGATITGGSLDVTSTSVSLGGATNITSTTLTTTGSSWDTNANALTWDGNGASFAGTMTIDSSGSFTVNTNSATLSGGITLNGGSLIAASDLTLSGGVGQTASSTLSVLSGRTITLSSTVNTDGFTLSLTGTGDISNSLANPLQCNNAAGTINLNSVWGSADYVQLATAGCNVTAPASFVIRYLYLANSATINVSANQELDIASQLYVSGNSTLTKTGAGDLYLHDVVLAANLTITGTVYLGPDATLMVVANATFAPGQNLAFNDGLVVNNGVTLTINDPSGTYTLTFNGGVTITGTGQVIVSGDESLILQYTGVDEATLAKITNSGTGSLTPANISLLDLATFWASPGDGSVTLNWTFQAGSYNQVMIRRDTSGYPANNAAGTLVYDGSATTTTDTGLTNGTLYYYKAFAHDGLGNYTSGMVGHAVPTVVTSSLVLYYPLDSHFFDGTGLKKDLVEHTTLVATTDMTNQAGEAYLFNGTGDVADMENLLTSGTDFSVSLWFKTTDATNQSATQWHEGNCLLDGHSTSNSSDWGLCLDNGFLLAGTGGGDTTIGTAGWAVNDGYWYNATLTRTQSSGAMALYLDGRLYDSGTGSTSALTTPTVLWLGASPHNSNYFAGSLDEVRLYSTVLTQANIELLHSAPLGLVTFHHFDGDANDHSGNALNGTPTSLTAANNKNAVANRAYSFNGTSSQISVPDDPSLDMTTAITIAVWFTTSNNTGALVGKWGATAAEQSYVLYAGSGAGYGFRLSNGTSNFIAVEGWSSEPVADGTTWNSLIAIYNGTTAEVYLNGVLVGSQSVTDSMTNSTSNLFIGSDNLASPSYFSGTLDDVRVYERAISSPEITKQAAGAGL